MQKFVSFLEKHVQWVALGLGAIYLLYMVWGYVIMKPVTIEVQGAPEKLTPGTIDQYILDNRIADLDQRMNASKTVEFKVPEYSAELGEIFSGGKAPAFDGQYVFSPSSKIQFQEQSGTGETVEDGTVKIAGLPTLPAPSITDQGAGRSLVMEVTQRGGGAARQPAAGARRGAAGRDDDDSDQGRDQDWVSVFFKIPVEALADAYKSASIKEELYGTIILDIQLIREKQQADGSWGDQTVIDQPEFLNIPPLPATNKAQQLAYADWADKNVQTVLQPPFYQVTRGAPWPPVQLTNEQVNEQTLKKLEEARQRKLADRKRQQDQLRKMQQQRRPNNTSRQPGRNSGRGMGGIPGMFAPRDTERPARRAQPAAPPMMPPMFDPMMGGMPGMPPGIMPGGDMPGMMPGGPGRQLNSTFKAPGLPQGEFDPSQLDEDIQGWAHDTTVEPGAIYRYQVKYIVRNPMFDMRGMVADPKLAEQFIIESPASEWSNEVEIEPLSYFFLAGGMPPGGQTVRFDVFRSTGAQWVVQSFEVSPGDLLGNTVNEVDFATGWTVAALRRDPRSGDTQILLVDEQGNLQFRDFASDQENPTYKDLKQQIAEAEVADTRPRAAAR